MYHAHLQLVYGGSGRIDANDHALNLAKEGVSWNPTQRIHLADLVTSGSAFPFNQDLLRAHRLSIRDRKDHATFVYRQSYFVDSFFGTYLDKITNITGRATEGLMSLGRDVESVALVSSMDVTSRYMPSFAADPVRKLHYMQFESRGTDATNDHLAKDCSTAARATWNMTNQLLYAKVHGRCPVLVSMGVNAISANWRRFVAFVTQYHHEHGHLDIMVRVTMSQYEEEEREREWSVPVICPRLTESQAFGCYTSYDVIRHEQKQVSIEEAGLISHMASTCALV